MIWLTWRQFRAAGAATFGALLLLAALLALTGPGIAGDYASGIAACTSHGGGCTGFLQQFFDSYRTVFLILTLVMLVLPALVGLFWGAPLITRELESGTHRLVWNQSITRTRWLTVKLGITGLAAIAAGGLASLAVTWWSSTIDQVASDEFPRLSPLVFDTRDIAPIGYAAFAFALGVTVGILVRRTLPAMAITLAVFVAVQIAMPTLVRPHLLPPTHATVEISPSLIDGFGRQPGGQIQIQIQAKAPDPGGWLLSSQTVDGSGKAVDGISLPAGSDACLPTGPPPANGSPFDQLTECVAEVNRLGYREQLTYHAPSRFWPFQWLETGIYLALALALSGFSFWQLRRRLS
jgi:hypothetical protein